MTAANNVDPKEHVDIRNLCACYNPCGDAGDAEGYASCFTEDGVLNLESLGFPRQGRDTLSAWPDLRNARQSHNLDGCIHN